MNSGIINGISAGMRMGNVLVMGSFAFEGFMVCPYDEKIPFDNWISYLDSQGIYSAFVSGLSRLFNIKAY